jgi:predicted alpha/beta-fold hydrolase
MGAKVLANYLGVYNTNSVVQGSVCINAAIKKWEGVRYFEKSLFGIYNRAMGKYQFDYLRANIDLLQPHFKKEYGIDLAYELET